MKIGTRTPIMDYLSGIHICPSGITQHHDYYDYIGSKLNISIDESFLDKPDAKIITEEVFKILVKNIPAKDMWVEIETLLSNNIK